MTVSPHACWRPKLCTHESGARGYDVSTLGSVPHTAPICPVLLRPSPQCPHLQPLLFCSNLNFLLLGKCVR